ncbi:hypothetical protein [Pantoea agglomerans]|uniref:hypothetical protein n=1 Tax=Enterobacter agglomerans TaxID=549 RepID=UPI003207B802
MENDLSKELSKAITDAISCVLKSRGIPHAVVQAKITVDGGSDWMAFAASVSGTELLGGGGGGGIASGVTGASGGKPD